MSVVEHQTFCNGFIVKTQGVVGGRARIAGSRMPVWCIYSMRNMPDEKVLHAYPWMTQRELDAAKRYIKEHLSEIEKDYWENVS